MEIINDQKDTDVTAVSGMTEPVPPLRSFANGNNESPNAAQEAGILITADTERSPADTGQHYKDIKLEVASTRIRSMLEKARGVIGNAIGTTANKTREFLTPQSRKVAVAGGIGAIAAGAAFKKAKSRS